MCLHTTTLQSSALSAGGMQHSLLVAQLFSSTAGPWYGWWMAHLPFRQRGTRTVIINNVQVDGFDSTQTFREIQKHLFEVIVELSVSSRWRFDTANTMASVGTLCSVVACARGRIGFAIDGVQVYPPVYQ